MGFLLLKATLLLLGTFLLGTLLRRASAAQRAAFYGASLVGLLLLPLVAVVAPPVPVIPLMLPEPVLRATSPTPVPAPLASLPAAKPTAVWFPRSQEPPEVTVPAVPSTPFPWERALIALLALGSVLSLLRVGAGLFGLRRFVCESTRAAEPVMAETAHLAAALHLPRLPDVRIASDTLGLSSPLTFGWWRGTILLPESSLTQPEGLRVALLHELVHLKRQDWLVLFGARLAAALWWFHPLVHVLVRQLRLEIEAACDDRVLRLGVSAPDDAGYLVAFARLATGEKS